MTILASNLFTQSSAWKTDAELLNKIDASHICSGKTGSLVLTTIYR